MTWRKWIVAVPIVLCLVVHVCARDISRGAGWLNNRLLDWAVKR